MFQLTNFLYEHKITTYKIRTFQVLFIKMHKNVWLNKRSLLMECFYVANQLHNEEFCVSNLDFLLTFIEMTKTSTFIAIICAYSMKLFPHIEHVCMC